MILTPDQRLRVFVSSTLGELAAERAAVREVIEAMRLAPVMFELGARPHPPRALYRAYLEQSHVFVAIYAERYGWVAPSMDMSGLEDEYRLSGERPKLVYVLDPAPAREERLTEMLVDVADDPRVTLRTYGSAEELARLVSDDLAELLAVAFAAPSTNAADAAAEATTAVRSVALPAATTPLIGRSAELAEVTGLLRRSDVRLVTVTGIGGIGKSRLALEAAHALVPDFPGGVVLVPLSVVPEAGLVISSVAANLDIHLDTTKPSLDTVADALADSGDVLLVLDNAEQVQDAADDLAGLINTCPSVTLLVTSRKRLRLSAEYDVPLQPLDLGQPDEGEGFGSPEWDPEALERSAMVSAAMQLFTDRAHAARPGLDLATDAVQRRAAIALCRRLEGVPLAIEIAAARVRLLLPTALLDRLDRRLDLPAARFADLPERQRTLRSTMDWSRDLLTPGEQQLLAQLSTFVGGASLDAVERVCRCDGDLLEALATLADHSLLAVDGTVVDAPRFTMLETVREYACELLGESGHTAQVEEAHKLWVLDLAERAKVALTGPAHAEWLERLELESGNIRAAGSRAHANGDPTTLAHIGYSLWLWLWSRHHTREARLWLERGLDAPVLDPLTHAQLVWAVAGAAIEQGDNDTARTRLAEAEAAFEALGDAEGLALSGFLRASLAPLDGDNELAISTFARCEGEFVKQDNVFLASICASTSGIIHSQLGRLDEAEVCLDRGLAYGRQIDNSMLLGQGLVARGFARLGRGALDDADDDLAAGAVHAHDCRNPEILSFACDGLAAVRLARGALDETAAALVGAAEGLRERAGVVPWPALRPVMAAIAEGVRAGTPDDVFEPAWARGRHLDLDGVLALASTPVSATPR